jgi:hypothetical protein
MPTTNTRRADPLSALGRSPAPGWRKLSAGAGILGAEAAAGYLHPALGETLAIADILIPLIIGLILITAILRGSDQTCERTFRLLRWITNRPEPPAPPHPRAQAKPLYENHHPLTAQTADSTPNRSAEKAYF